jgi:hypothetical protein
MREGVKKEYQFLYNMPLEKRIKNENLMPNFTNLALTIMGCPITF